MKKINPRNITLFSFKAIIALLIITVSASILPGATGLWYEKLNANITVSTGDWSYPRSKGYWCHTLANSICGGCHHYNTPGYNNITNYLEEISNNSTVFSFEGTGYENIVYAMELMHCCGSIHRCGINMEDKLKAQLLAVWLNVVSGYGDGYVLTLTNGSRITGMWIINASEAAIVNGDVGSYESLKNLCEEYNTRWEG